jgi:hypothetical protein
MTGKTLSLRLLALTFGIAGAIFAVTAAYRGLLVHTNPIVAPVTMAIISALMAITFVIIAQIRAERRRAKMRVMMSNLIDHKPLAGLAAAVVAGAAARFGIEPDDLFPIFEAFTKPPLEEGPQPEFSPPPPATSTSHSTHSVH